MSYIALAAQAIFHFVLNIIPIVAISLFGVAILFWANRSTARPLTDEERQAKLSEIAQRVKAERRAARERSPAD